MRRKDLSRWLVVPAAAVLLALAACGGGDEKNNILPTYTSFTVTPPLTDQLVFLQKNPADTNNADNIVIVDVMLRHNAGVNFTAFTLEVTFDPGVVQVGQVDASATPLGECGGAGLCPPLCADNVDPSNATPANATGDLVIGVAKTCGAAATVTGTDRLLTISFIGASVGQSTLTLVDDAGHGDCEILDSNGDPLPITCDSGGAMVTVAR